MELSIQERLKDLRVERGLTLEQLAEQTHLSKSALGSYEAEDFKDISHYALIKLAKFYGVTTDYLLGLSQTKNHSNADLADLRLSDDMIELLKSGRVDNSLLCELAAHPDFPRLMADLEIYVNGVAGKQVQSANAIVDAVSATIMKQHNPGLTDPQLRQLIAAHIDDDSFCRYVIQQDISKIALDLRETHTTRPAPPRCCRPAPTRYHSTGASAAGMWPRRICSRFLRRRGRRTPARRWQA